MSEHYSININGRLLQLDKPVVMGILNVTPDSFYADSRIASDDALLSAARDMLNAGAAILDVGACSTRPSGEPVSQAEELKRLHAALDVLDKHLPGAVVSLDTYRGAVASECARCHNVAIINDVSGFGWDDEMFQAVAALNIPYILTHSQGWAGGKGEYSEMVPEILASLASKMWQLHSEGVKDVIVDPGFGFGKSVEQNYDLLASLPAFKMLDAPLLVGLSRKSMITRPLSVEPSDALAGTVALNMAALQRGANILRVHDVKEAVQVIRLYEELNAAEQRAAKNGE